jgi:hypothetical protein
MQWCQVHVYPSLSWGAATKHGVLAKYLQGVGGPPAYSRAGLDSIGCSCVHVPKRNKVRLTGDTFINTNMAISREFSIAFDVR